MPPVIAHRGHSAAAPENTLESFRAAADCGAGAVEFDIKLSRDGIPVVIHDDRVDRTTDGRGAVRDLTLAQLRALDAGSWFAPAFAGARIPTLVEVLALCRERGLAVNAELKPCRRRDRETAQATALILESRWPAAAPPILLSSFSMLALAVAQELAPDIPRAVLIDHGRTRAWRRLAREHTASAVHSRAPAWTHHRITELRSAGLTCGAYTVNDPQQAQLLRQIGVDYLFSDVPDRLLAAL